MLLSQAVQEYLIEHEIQGHSPHTIRNYRENLSAFQRYTGDLEVGTLTQGHLRDYYRFLSSRPLSSVTVQTYFRAIRAFLTWCFHEGYTDTNLPEKFRLPKARRRTIDVLTDGEISRLLACFDAKTFLGLRNLCMVLLMLDSGLRLNEVITLSLGSLHVAEGYLIAQGKGGKERFVPLGLNTKKYILRYLSRIPQGSLQTPLFVKDTFSPVGMTTLKQLFRKLKIQSGIPRLRAHLLRHTFATRYLEQGGDLYSLQAILGHTTLEMVRRYVHIRPGKMAVSFTQYSPVDNLVKRSRTP